MISFKALLKPRKKLNIGEEKENKLENLDFLFPASVLTHNSLHYKALNKQHT
jgi:hypothetical protein